MRVRAYSKKFGGFIYDSFGTLDAHPEDTRGFHVDVTANSVWQDARDDEGVPIMLGTGIMVGWVELFEGDTVNFRFGESVISGAVKLHDAAFAIMNSRGRPLCSHLCGAHAMQLTITGNIYNAKAVEHIHG